MNTGNTITIDGHVLSDSCLTATLADMPTGGFTKTDFGNGLIKHGFAPASDSDLLRRLMQKVQTAGLITHDNAIQL